MSRAIRIKLGELHALCKERNFESPIWIEYRIEGANGKIEKHFAFIDDKVIKKMYKGESVVVGRLQKGDKVLF